MELVMLDRWLMLLTRVSDHLDTGAGRAVFDTLLTRYTAPDRHYHNLRHIDACLRLLDSVRGLAVRPDAIELAIWFHDAIYDSHRSDNEESSARMAVDALLGLGVCPTTTQSVHDLILATRHDGPPVDPDTALLMDIDLSILGQPASAFDDYEKGIRCEYGWVSEPGFRAGRSKVLQSFLDRPHIYATEHFRAAFETVSRQNLARALAQLSG